MQSLNQAHLICMELVHLIRWTTDYSLDYTSQDYYYLGSEYECFAEIMARYVQGDISDEGLQEFCKEMIEGI